MNIPPSEAKHLTLFEYQALFHNWQRIHETDDGELEPPSLEETLERRAKLEAEGIKVLH